MGVVVNWTNLVGHAVGPLRHGLDQLFAPCSAIMAQMLANGAGFGPAVCSSVGSHYQGTFVAGPCTETHGQHVAATAQTPFLAVATVRSDPGMPWRTPQSYKYWGRWMVSPHLPSSFPPLQAYHR